MRVALLAGGTGGAKLAAGMQEEVGSELSVIANTGDDIEALGVHVSPDPDLVTYWLSGEIDEERGWGIRDDAFTVFERLQLLGAPSWFGLSDRDLAACLYRRQFLAEGGRPDRRPGADRPRPRGRGEGAADVRLAGPDQGADRGGAPRAAGVPDRRPRRARRRRGRAGGDRERRAEPRGAGRAARRRGDRDRPLQPGDQHRPDPRRAGDARGDRRLPRPGRRRQPLRRRRGRQGPDRPLHGRRSAGPAPPPASPRSTPG